MPFVPMKGSTVNMRKRVLFVFAFIGILSFVVLIYRLVLLQVFQSNFLEDMALEQQLSNTKLKARRGVIYDKNFVILAKSATTWTVVLEPPSINEKNRKIICQGLSEIFGISEEEIKKLSLKKTFYSIAEKNIDCEKRNKVIEFKNKNGITNGVRLIETNKRYYPFGAFLAQALGFVGSDGQGLAGIEASYENYLKGEDGKLVNAKNAIGTEMPWDYEQIISPKEGYNLRLTIDSNVQRIVERYLSESIKINKVQNRGVAIAIDPKNGEILALAVKEDFDPNNPFKIVDENDKKIIENAPESKKSKIRNEILSKQWRNKAISDTYYPGSVFKMVVAAMGFQLGLINEDSSFNCNGGIKISERSQYIKCHKRGGHGQQNFIKALCNSCNPAFILLGQKIGVENFFKFYKDFGFHERTGIDLPGEAKDLFFSQSGKMTPIELAVASMGQNFGITAIQMACAACAIANGGYLIKPHIVKEIIDKDGKVIKSFDQNSKKNIISEDISSRVSRILALNAINGGAKNAYIPGFKIAGKTGTSEKIGLSTPGFKDYISSFCGYAPADDPKIVLLIFLDTPRGESYYGGLIVAPVFANIMTCVLPYLGIKEKFSEEEIEKYGMSMPDFISKKTYIAREMANLSDLKAVILGKGEKIISQMPTPGERVPKGSTIILYTENLNAEKIKVPNFKGLTLEEAKELAKKSGLTIRTFGCLDGTVSYQSILINEYAIVGTVIDLKFISTDHINE